MKPTILAIETATSSCSVALSLGEKIVSRNEVGNNIHSQALLQMVSDVFDELNLTVSELDAVAVGQGPGSFTGLRIGVGVAQGVAYGANCKMIGVSSLAALAQQSKPQASTIDGNIIAGIDARMGEIYWARYSKSGTGVLLEGDLRVTKPQEITVVSNMDAAMDSGGVVLVGNAWAEYADLLDRDLMAESEWLDDIIYPSAEGILGLAFNKYENDDMVSPIHFTPEYVRNDVAKKPKKTTINN